MQKRTVSKVSAIVGGTILTALTVTLLSVAQGHAAEHAVNGTVNLPQDLSMIEGKVLFQKRSTIVPLGGFTQAGGEGMLAAMQPFCDGRTCPSSTTYWALEVQDGQRTYEFHQPFALGSSRAPESVRVAGVEIRPGVSVAVEGTVESVSANYGIISDVKSVSLIMDSHVLDQSESVWSVDSGGWHCKSLPTVDTAKVRAFVWYGKRTPLEGEAYHLRVTTERMHDDANLQNVADIGNVEVEQNADQIIYQGIVNHAEALLAIHQSPSDLLNFPSTLRISGAKSNTAQVFPVSGDIPMLCIPGNYSAAFRN